MRIRESLRMHLICGLFLMIGSSLSPHKRVLNPKFLNLFGSDVPTSLGTAVFHWPHTGNLHFCPLGTEVLFLRWRDLPWGSRLTVTGEQRLCLPSCQISRTSSGLVHRESQSDLMQPKILWQHYCFLLEAIATKTSVGKPELESTSSILG